MARLTRALPVGTVCKVSCNSGVKTCRIISVYNLGGAKRRKLSASIGSIVAVVAVDAPITLRRKVLKAVVVTQVKPINRPLGRVAFTRNSVVILKDDLTVMGTRIHGVVAKEAERRVPTVTGKGSIVY